MAGSKEIKRRIESVQNTKQITSAMKMVSASKLRKVQAKLGSGDVYRTQLSRLLANLSENVEDITDIPLLEIREVTSIALVVITANRGLCGGYNHHLLKQALEFYEEKKALGVDIGIIAVGKKAEEFFLRRGLRVDQSFLDFSDIGEQEDALTLSEALKEAYLQKRYDEIYLAYQAFGSVISQTPTIIRLLPASCEQIEDKEKVDDAQETTYLPNYIFEPEPQEILSLLLARYFQVMIESALIEARAGEHGARMTAMSAATDNATELLQTLKLSYNRARQAAITSEITEIVAGVNAL